MADMLSSHGHGLFWLRGISQLFIRQDFVLNDMRAFLTACQIMAHRNSVWPSHETRYPDVFIRSPNPFRTTTEVITVPEHGKWQS
jgi:hypothetical protein